MKKESRKERKTVVEYKNGKKTLLKNLDIKKKKPIANSSNESTKKS